MKQIIGTRPAKTTLRRRYETKSEYGSGRGWKDDGTRSGTVTIVVDLDRIAALYGPRALSNKGGKARGMNGCVEVILTGPVVDVRLPRTKYLVPVMLSGNEIDGIIVEETSPEDAKSAASVGFYEKGYKESTGHSLGQPLTEDV